MGKMLGLAVTIFRTTSSRISGPGRSWGIWYNRPVPAVRSYTSRISGTSQSWGIWYNRLVPFVRSHDHVYLVLADHGEYGTTGRYHLCDHIHHVYLVPADPREHGRTRRYQLCDHIHPKN